MIALSILWWLSASGGETECMYFVIYSCWPWTMQNKQWKLLVRYQEWSNIFCLSSKDYFESIFVIVWNYYLLSKLYLCHSKENPWWHIFGFQASHLKGCDCPPGFRGDGKHSCEGNATFHRFSLCAIYIPFSSFNVCVHSSIKVLEPWKWVTQLSTHWKWVTQLSTHCKCLSLIP
jgi:hypothetical protein